MKQRERKEESKTKKKFQENILYHTAQHRIYDGRQNGTVNEEQKTVTAGD
jgi:hypothetical protein